MDPYQKNRDLSYKSYITKIQSLYDEPVTQTSSALILTLATIAFFGLAAIRPTLGTVSKLIGELKEKRSIDMQLKQKIDNLSLAQDEYIASQTILESFDTAIPLAQNYQLLLLQLEYLAKNSNTTLDSLRLNSLTTLGQSPEKIVKQPDTDIPPEAYPSFEISFSAEGKYQDLKTLLSRVDTLDRLLKIESVTFSQNQNEDAPSVVQMSIKLRAFWDPNIDSEILTDTTP